MVDGGGDPGPTGERPRGRLPGPQVTALLLNYRGATMTLCCLRDLLQVCADVDLRVLLLDNASGEDDLEELRRGLDELPADEAKRVELVPLDNNSGFTGGMNHGLRLAHERGARYALVLNNDLRLSDAFVRPLVEVMENDPQVAVVGPTVLQPDGSVWAEGGEVGFAANALRLIRHNKPPRPREHGPESVGFVPGACVLLRLDAVAEVGMFDDDYFMYWEDVALCHRLRQAGHKVVWLPWVRIEHFAGQSSGGGRSPLRKFLMACNAVRYLKSHGSAAGWLGWLCFDVLLWPIALVTGPAAALAKMRGTWAGLCGHRASAEDVRRYLS
ncbi:MAG: glycosyltransferase family 2 protein [Planctomycetota bacterium]